MRKVLKWLVQPDVLPLVARLLLVALTAVVAEPEVAAGAGAALELAARQVAGR